MKNKTVWIFKIKFFLIILLLQILHVLEAICDCILYILKSTFKPLHIRNDMLGNDRRKNYSYYQTSSVISMLFLYIYYIMYLIKLTIFFESYTTSYRNLMEVYINCVILNITEVTIQSLSYLTIHSIVIYCKIYIFSTQVNIIIILL